jgi:hypothetical protein
MRPTARRDAFQETWYARLEPERFRVVDHRPDQVSSGLMLGF